MVHELALDGSVVRLTNLSLPDDSDNSQVRMLHQICIFIVLNFFSLVSGYKGQIGDSVLCWGCEQAAKVIRKFGQGWACWHKGEYSRDCSSVSITQEICRFSFSLISSLVPSLVPASFPFSQPSFLGLGTRFLCLKFWSTELWSYRLLVCPMMS